MSTEAVAAGSDPVGQDAREEGIIDERENFIDATFAAAKDVGEVVDLAKRV